MMNLVAKIRAAGESCGRRDGRLPVCRVKCRGCGEEIRSDEDLTDVQYVKTKRGSELFFHTGDKKICKRQKGAGIDRPVN